MHWYATKTTAIQKCVMMCSELNPKHVFVVQFDLYLCIKLQR